MRKEVKRFGNSHGITLDAEDMKVYSLKVGDFIYVSDLIKVKNGNNKRKK